MMVQRLALVSLLLALGLAACSSDSPGGHAAEPAEEPTIPFRKDATLDLVREGGVYLTLDVEIAETDSARTRGLMQREALPERSGMLFLFDREQPQSFWMANTPLALDLVFIDRDSQIVDLAKYTRPLSPDQIVSEVPARFVLEVTAGFADAHGIIEGDRVRWRRTVDP